MASSKKMLTITGSSGMIGRNILKFCNLEEYDLLLHSLHNSINFDNFLNVKSVAGSFYKKEVCSEIAAKSDIIIHLAQAGSPITSVDGYEEYMAENLMPTLKLLDEIKKVNRKIHFIFASSAGALYQSSSSGSYNETSPVCPLTAYGIVKYTIENVLQSLSVTSNIKVTILRISNPYGSLLDPNRMQGLIGVVLSRLKSGLPAKIFGDISNIRDYIFIEDLVNLFQKIIRTPPENKYNLYNIGFGTGYSVKQIIALIEKVLKRKIPIEYEKISGDDLLPKRIVLDISKAKRTFNWEPETDIERGISIMARECGLIS